MWSCTELPWYCILGVGFIPSIHTLPQRYVDPKEFDLKKRSSLQRAHLEVTCSAEHWETMLH